MFKRSFAINKANSHHYMPTTFYLVVMAKMRTNLSLANKNASLATKYQKAGFFSQSLYLGKLEVRTIF